MSSRSQAARAWRAFFTAWLVMTVMSVAAGLMLLVAIPTFFQARRLYIEVIARPFARLLLWLCGVRLIVHQDRPWPTKQTIYLSNHTSALDVFVLIALGLPRTRFFLSGFLRAIVPLGVMGRLAGTFWTVPQTRPQDRVKLFQRADAILRRTRDSAYLSPEGTRVQTGEIGKFNKGAFHLATSLQTPILPLYLAVPLPEVDLTTPVLDPKSYTVQVNLMSFLGDIRPCKVEVFVGPLIDTTGWKLEDLEKNRDAVREQYLRMHEMWKAV